MNRRDFLLRSAMAGAVLGLPGRALAQDAGADRKILFVFNPGGWDPTRVLAPAFDNPAVSMEADAEIATAGGIQYVDHPARPGVRSFFEANRSRSLVLRGLMVRSIAHDICTMIAMTGTSDGTSPDWPAAIADGRREDYTLPHLVLDGPSFPGDLGAAVARTGVNGQLASLLSGEALAMSDLPVSRLSRPSEAIVDRYLARRAAARADFPAGARDARLSSDLRASVDRAAALKDLQYTMSFGAGGGFTDEIDVAVQALALGVSRCVTLAHYGATQGLGWDTHTQNDDGQSPSWERLFQGLSYLMSLLDSTPGRTAPTLAEETLVVVLSEMGRTPMLNSFQGKDHWPYTSALLIGSGITGDRVVGGYDANFYGLPVDAISGDTTESGQVLSAEALGATLLVAAGVDPEPYAPGVDPIVGVLT